MHNFRDVKAGNVHVMVHTVEKNDFLVRLQLSLTGGCCLKPPVEGELGNCCVDGTAAAAATENVESN